MTSRRPASLASAGGWCGGRIDEREAARQIRRRDRAVARYLWHFYRVDWTDPSLYHLVVNTTALGDEGAIRLLLQAAPPAEEPAEPGGGQRMQSWVETPGPI